MNQLLLIVIIAILVIFFINNSCPKKETYACINPNTKLIPKKILNFKDAVDTFNCNTPIPLGNSKNPQNYDAYKLTIKINKFNISKVTNNIENNVEYNICGGLNDTDKISWRLFLKLSPTTDYLLKDLRYDLYLELNNSNPIYIPSVSSINNFPVRGSYEFNRSYELTIYKTQNYCYLGAVETFSNKPDNRFPEFKMDLYNLYNSPTKSSKINSLFVNNYSTNNYIVYTTSTSDLPNQPIINTLENCKSDCSKDNTCVGFSRNKYINDNNVSECYLKKDIINNPKLLNDPTWHTFTNIKDIITSIKDIISNNKFFSSDTVPAPEKSIKLIGGSGSCILQAYSLEP
jgi:hypothetical protein